MKSKKNKKILSLLLVLAMIITVFPASTFARDGESDNAELKIEFKQPKKLEGITNNGALVIVVSVNENNQPIANKEVSLEIEGNKYNISTNTEGDAVLKYTVNFNGDENTKNITIKASIGESLSKELSVNLTRLYKVNVQNGRLLTIVNNGYLKDANVIVEANDKNKFDHWEVPESLKNLGESKLKNAELQFKMPSEDITIKAINKSSDGGSAKPTEPEKTENEYKLTLGRRVSAYTDSDREDEIKDGSKVKEGTKVYLEADSRRDYTFDEFESDEVNIKSKSSRTGAYFTMPAKDVKVTASYDYDRDYYWYDLNRVYPTKLERTDNGRRTEGKLSSYKNEKVYVYYDGDEIGSGWTDSDGEFDIKLDDKYTSSEHDDFKYYVDADKSEDNLKRVYPSNVRLYDKKSGEYRYVEGKLSSYKNEKIYVYLNGNEKGNGWINSDGKFDFKLDKYIDDKYDEDDLRFYVDEEVSSTATDIFVTKALAGEKVLTGKNGGNKAEITVKDSKGYKLGTATADSDGNFTVYLNRALIAQETLTIYSNMSKSSEEKIEYIVPGGFINAPDNIASSSTNGYIKGVSEHYFKPNDNMTRAEAAAMMARLVNGSENFGNVSSVTKFYDANNAWYSKAVNYAVSKGIINGYSDGTFKPNENITRAEFAKMISNYIKTTENKSMNFNDVTNKHWAAASIQKAYAAGVVNGYSDGTFKPDAKITRAEAVKMLNKVFNKKATSYTKSFYDVQPRDWFYTDVMNAAN